MCGEASAGVSVILIVKNEEANLPRCLESLTFSDDVIVVDDGSQDNTVQLAEAAGARVCAHGMESFAAQRNWAMTNAEPRHDWVLHLDADEVVPDDLAAEIVERTRDAADDTAGFYMARKTMLGDRWLRRSATYPAYVPRLVRRGRVTYAADGHGEKLAEVEGRFGYLDYPCLHYNFSKGWADWFDRHNRYSTAEAQKLADEGCAVDWSGLVSGDAARRRRAMRAFSYRLPFRPWLRFFYVLVFCGGFLDGRCGLTSSALQALYEYMICLKVRELRRTRSRDRRVE